jgi:hypothetical protein
MPMISVPSGLDNNSKTTMDTYMFDPVEKQKQVEKEKRVDRESKVGSIKLSLWKDNDCVCKNIISNGRVDDLYDY